MGGRIPRCAWQPRGSAWTLTQRTPRLYGRHPVELAGSPVSPRGTSRHPRGERPPPAFLPYAHLIRRSEKARRFQLPSSHVSYGDIRRYHLRRSATDPVRFVIPAYPARFMFRFCARARVFGIEPLRIMRPHRSLIGHLEDRSLIRVSRHRIFAVQTYAAVRECGRGDVDSRLRR